jgi:CBS domain-containing protein
MTADVVTIRGDVPLSDAVARLADSHVSGLAVLDGTGRLIGVVTTNDVLGAEAEAEITGLGRECSRRVSSPMS